MMLSNVGSTPVEPVSETRGCPSASGAATGPDTGYGYVAIWVTVAGTGIGLFGLAFVPWLKSSRRHAAEQQAARRA